MKLSFTLSSKKPTSATSAAAKGSISAAFEPSTSPTTDNDSAAKEFVTEFDPPKPLGVATVKRLAVIAPKPNEWMPAAKKMKALHQLPSTESSGGADDSKDIENGGSDSMMSYGLNLRHNNAAASSGGGGGVDDPLLVKFKEDMERLPEGPRFEEFEDVPVEGYGAALLSGYGWKKGRGVGRRAKGDVKVAKCFKWPGKQGIGFVADDNEPLAATAAAAAAAASSSSSEIVR